MTITPPLGFVELMAIETVSKDRDKYISKRPALNSTGMSDYCRDFESI
jgi:hypothetical protein